MLAKLVDRRFDLNAKIGRPGALQCEGCGDPVYELFEVEVNGTLHFPMCQSCVGNALFRELCEEAEEETDGASS